MLLRFLEFTVFILSHSLLFFNEWIPIVSGSVFYTFSLHSNNRE